jgi:hypothetical protein
MDDPQKLSAVQTAWRRVSPYALAIILVALALLILLALQNSFGNPFWFARFSRASKIMEQYHHHCNVRASLRRASLAL